MSLHEKVRCNTMYIVYYLLYKKYIHTHTHTYLFWGKKTAFMDWGRKKSEGNKDVSETSLNMSLNIILILKPCKYFTDWKNNSKRKKSKL